MSENKFGTSVFHRYLFFVFFSNFSTIASFLSMYLVAEGLDLALISWLLLIYQAVRLVLEAPSGYLCDRLGRKTTGLLGLVFLLGYYASLILCNDVALAVGFVCRGLGFSFLSGSFEALYVESVDGEQLLRNNTVERAVFYVSVGLGSLLGGFLAAAGAYQLGIWVDVVFVVLTLLVCAGFRDGVHGERRSPARIGDALAVVSGNVPLLCLFGMDCFLAFSFVGIEQYYTLFLEESGLGAQWSGIAVTAQLLISACVGLAAPRIIGLTGSRRLFLGGIAVQLLPVVVFLIPGVPTGALPLLYILSQVGYALAAPIKYDLFQKAIPDALRATFISLQSLMVSLGGIGFYGLSGALSTMLGLRGVLVVAFAGTLASYVPCGLRASRELVR